MEGRVGSREELVEVKEASLPELQKSLEYSINSYHSAKENYEFETASMLFVEINKFKTEIMRRKGNS